MKGYLRQRKGVWYTTFDLPRRPGEPRKQKCERIGAMKRTEAEEREREVLRNYDDGSYARESNLTVADLLCVWLRDREHRLASKTYESYESKVRCHLIPALGSIPLKKLQPRHIVDAYAEIRKKHLSPQTLVHLHRILHTALNYAEKTLKVVRENAAAVVDAPSIGARPVVAMSEEQVRFIIEAAKGTRLEVPVLLAALTGLRRGELLALKWGTCIDFDRKQLSVTEVVEDSNRHGVRLVPRTKTKSPRRVIPMSGILSERLSQHANSQDQNRAEFGAAYIENDLVFCNPDGSLWPPDSFTKQFAEIVASIGLRGKFRFHDLRHAFATLTINNGVSIKEVSALLGHASPLLTLSTYAHLMEGQGRDAVDGLAKSLFGAAKGATGS